MLALSRRACRLRQLHVNHPHQKQLLVLLHLQLLLTVLSQHNVFLQMDDAALMETIRAQDRDLVIAVATAVTGEQLYKIKLSTC